jgi:hypothetical protein
MFKRVTAILIPSNSAVVIHSVAAGARGSQSPNFHKFFSHPCMDRGGFLCGGPGTSGVGYSLFCSLQPFFPITLQAVIQCVWIRGEDGTLLPCHTVPVAVSLPPPFLPVLRQKRIMGRPSALWRYCGEEAWPVYSFTPLHD